MAHSSSPSRCNPSGGICRKWTFTRETFRSSFAKFVAEGCGHLNGKETFHISAKARDLFHDPGAKVSVFFLRHQKNRFNPGFELPIHQCHLELEFKIRH